MQDSHFPHVLMLGWEFPPLYAGGLGIACQAIAKELSKELSLTVIVPNASDAHTSETFALFDTMGRKHHIHTGENWEAEEDSWRGLVNKHRVDVALDPYAQAEPLPEVMTEQYADRNNLPTSPKNLYDKGLGDRIAEFANQVVSLTKEKSLAYDVIYAHDWMTFPAALALSEASGKKVVLHVHSTEYDRSGGINFRGLTSQLEKKAFSLADHIIAVSNYTAHILTTVYHVPEGKITVVHNGHEPIKAHTSSGSKFREKLVLFLGRITIQKGPDYFFRIVEKVFEAYPNVRFIMAGSGDRLRNAIETSTYSRFAHKIHFTGSMNRDKVYQLYSMSDVYCMPSVSEPFGLTALEAAQQGVPCVLSKQSGVAEVLEGALVADYFDTDNYARHIIDLLEDEGLRNGVISAQREALKKLTWKVASSRITNLFQSLMNTEV